MALDDNSQEGFGLFQHFPTSPPSAAPQSQSTSTKPDLSWDNYCSFPSFSHPPLHPPDHTPRYRRTPTPLHPELAAASSFSPETHSTAYPNHNLRPRRNQYSYAAMNRSPQLSDSPERDNSTSVDDVVFHNDANDHDWSPRSLTKAPTKKKKGKSSSKARKRLHGRAEPGRPINWTGIRESWIVASPDHAPPVPPLATLLPHLPPPYPEHLRPQNTRDTVITTTGSPREPSTQDVDAGIAIEVEEALGSGLSD